MHEPRMLNGYIVIYRPNHPDSMKGRGYNGFVYEHRIVAEKKIGRRLRIYECVHHVDLNRSNNNPENIEVMKMNEHTTLHNNIKNIKNGYKVTTYKKCYICNNKTKNKKYCSRKCYRIGSRKCKLPSLFSILKSIKSIGYEATGRKYGVSGNAVKKWIKKYIKETGTKINMKNVSKFKNGNRTSQERG